MVMSHDGGSYQLPRWYNKKLTSFEFENLSLPVGGATSIAINGNDAHFIAVGR